MNAGAIELSAVVMFFIGFYGVITSKNIIKSIITIGLMEAAVVVFFLSIGFVPGSLPPIGHDLVTAADPLPQSVVLTAIIIGLAVVAVNLTILITLMRQSNSAEWDVVKSQNSEIAR